MTNAFNKSTLPLLSLEHKASVKAFHLFIPVSFNFVDSRYDSLNRGSVRCKTPTYTG
jgi:hypothetical protein